MKTILLMCLLLLASTTNARIRKRLISGGDKTNNSRDSFDVNVSAGYGIGSDGNITGDVPQYLHPYYFQERQPENATSFNPADQISVATIPKHTAYRVSETSPDLQEKSYHPGGKYRYRTVVQHSRTRPDLAEIQNVLNNLEQGESPSNYGTRPKSPSKIVEVVRVPAIYELHLQSDNQDPQRFVTLNPWGPKTVTNTRHKYSDYQQPQQYFNRGALKSIRYQNTQFNSNRPQLQQNYNFVQHPAVTVTATATATGSVYNNKPKTNFPHLFGYSNAGPEQPNFSSYFDDFKQQLKMPQRPKILPTPSYHKEEILRPQNDISQDYYRKPQAIHEVPAPVLGTRPSHGFPRPRPAAIIPVTVAPLVYENHETTFNSAAFPPINQQEYQEYVPGPLDNIQMKPVTINYGAGMTKGQVDSIPTVYNDYYNLMTSHLEPTPVYQNEDLGTNAEIGSYLDQSVLRPEQIDWQYYQQTPEIVSPSTDNNLDNSQDHYQNLATNKEQVNPAQPIFSQNIAPDINMLLVRTPQQNYAANGESEPQQNPSYNNFHYLRHNGRLEVPPQRQLNRPRPFGQSNRRHAPMDYIILIKKRTAE